MEQFYAFAFFLATFLFILVIGVIKEEISSLIKRFEQEIEKEKKTVRCPYCSQEIPEEKFIIKNPFELRVKVKCEHCGAKMTYDVLGGIPVLISREPPINKVSAFILAILLPQLSLAISESDVIQGAISGKMRFERGTLFGTSGEMTDKMIQHMKMKHPNFKADFWFYHAKIDGDSVHVIWYDWTDRKCRYAKTSNNINTKELTEEDGQVSFGSMKAIDIRACESLYNFISSQ